MPGAGEVGSSADVDDVGEEQVHPAVARVLREHDADGVLGLLGERLSGSDLTALLLEVMRRRAIGVTPADVLAQYERDRFVRPAAVDARRLLEVELLALDTVSPPFVPIATSPLLPLGAHSVVAGVHQNRVVTTVRGSEVAADPTNSLALEAAVRRRQLLASNPRSAAVVHLASVDRVVRAQLFDGRCRSPTSRCSVSSPPSPPTSRSGRSARRHGATTRTCASS